MYSYLLVYKSDIYSQMKAIRLNILYGSDDYGIYKIFYFHLTIFDSFHLFYAI